MSVRLYSFAEVEGTGNEPDVAFDSGTEFFLGLVSLKNTAPLSSYLVEHDMASVHTIVEMLSLYRAFGVDALPPVLANAELHVEDGAHRMAAALEMGWVGLPAFIEFRGTSRE